MQEMVYKQKIRDVDELRERTVESWDHIDQSIIDYAISQWCRRVLERMADIPSTDCDFCIQYLPSNFRVMIR